MWGRERRRWVTRRERTCASEAKKKYIYSYKNISQRWKGQNHHLAHWARVKGVNQKNWVFSFWFRVSYFWLAFNSFFICPRAFCLPPLHSNSNSLIQTPSQTHAFCLLANYAWLNLYTRFDWGGLCQSWPPYISRDEKFVYFQLRMTFTFKKIGLSRTWNILYPHLPLRVFWTKPGIVTFVAINTAPRHGFLTWNPATACAHAAAFRYSRGAWSE